MFYFSIGEVAGMSKEIIVGNLVLMKASHSGRLCPILEECSHRKSYGI